MERYRTLAALAAVVVGAVIGWLIGGGDVATLRAAWRTRPRWTR